jgi:hypothetical protein
VIQLSSFALCLSLAVPGAGLDLTSLRQSIAAEGLEWEAGPTPFTTGLHSLPPLPATNPLADLARAEPDHARRGPLATWQSGSLADAYFSWHDRDGESFLSGVRAQGACGACFIFASLGAVESLFAIALDAPAYDIDMSEQHLLSCISFGSCAGGGLSQEVGQQLIDVGVVDETCLPYQAVETTCGANLCSDWEGRTARIADWSSSISPWSVTELKTALLDGPLAVNMQIYDDFPAYVSGVYSRTTAAVPTGWHVVTLVGWNDYHDSWIAKNSWGSDWGMEGYFEIRRAEDCDLIGGTGVCFGANAVTFEVETAEAPAWPCIEPMEVSVSTHREAPPTARVVTLRNCGRKRQLDFTFAAPPTGVRISPMAATLAVGASLPVTVTVDPNGFVIGTHEVTLPVTTHTGQSQIVLALEIAAAPPPVVAFVATPDSGTPPLTVAFSNRTSGNVSAYRWDFGDGQSSTATNPTHTFTAPGAYQVTLAATWSGGVVTVPGVVAVVAPDTGNGDGKDDADSDGGCAAVTPSGALLGCLALLRRRRRRG